MPKGKKKKQIKKFDYKIAEEEGGGGTHQTFDEFYKFNVNIKLPNPMNCRNLHSVILYLISFETF